MKEDGTAYAIDGSMSNSMNSFYTRLPALMIISIISFAGLSVNAQAKNDAQPATISRVCLWNADQSTWRTLGLRGSQIARMNELRDLYPAVVDGQWVGVEDVAPVPIENDPVGAAPNVSTSITGPVSSSTAPAQNNESSTPATTTPATGLQYHLRAVLTPVQLRRWAQQCNY